ncbi:MAG: hypothetical protein VCD00_04365, partial [Candidatus Hydrogenedentota bacterium]
MDPSSISSSESNRQWPRVMPAGWLALGIFLVVTVVMHLLPGDTFVEADSVVIRNMKVTETEYRAYDITSPKLLILGTSRLGDTDVKALANEAGLNRSEVLNLSSPGATFFYIDSFLRHHPRILEEVEL